MLTNTLEWVIVFLVLSGVVKFVKYGNRKMLWIALLIVFVAGMVFQSNFGVNGEMHWTMSVHSVWALVAGTLLGGAVKARA